MTAIIAMPLTRQDLQAALGNNLKVVQAFERLFRNVADTSAAVTTGADATSALNDATVITLSPNAAFNNERVLAFDPASLTVTDHGVGGTLAIAGRVAVTGTFRCALSLSADTNVTLPGSGRIPSSADGPYASDAAAAAAGIAVGEIYRGPTGTVVWRQV